MGASGSKSHHYGGRHWYWYGQVEDLKYKLEQVTRQLLEARQHGFYSVEPILREAHTLLREISEIVDHSSDEKKLVETVENNVRLALKGDTFHLKDLALAALYKLVYPGQSVPEYKKRREISVENTTDHLAYLLASGNLNTENLVRELTQLKGLGSYYLYTFVTGLLDEIRDDPAGHRPENMVYRLVKKVYPHGSYHVKGWAYE